MGSRENLTEIPAYINKFVELLYGRLYLLNLYVSNWLAINQMVVAGLGSSGVPWQQAAFNTKFMFKSIL